MARDVKIAILGDASDFARAIRQAEGSAAAFDKSASRISGSMKIAMAAAGASAVAFAKSSVNAFIDAEKSQEQLSSAFAKFPQLAGASEDALLKLNTALAKKTKFDDDATASGQAVLAGFGLTAKQLAQMTPLLQDYAVRTGKTLPDAARDLGKAVLGQGRALKDIGFKFKDTGSAAGNLQELMGGLNAKVGGFAEKEGKTAAGQAEILRNQFKELEEKIGGFLVPALTKLAGVLIGLGQWLGEHQPVLIAFGVAVGVGLVAAFTAWATSAAAAAAATIAATWPVIAVAAAIAALVAGVVYAYQNWGWFHDAVDKVAKFLTGVLWPAIQAGVGWLADRLGPAISAVAGFITGSLIPAFAAVISKLLEWGSTGAQVAGWILEKIGSVISFVVSMPGTIGKAVAGMWDGLKAGLQAVVDWILKQLDRVLGPIDEIIGKVGKITGGVLGKIGGALGHIPGFANGVSNFGGGFAVVGERGPELVNLPGGSDVIPMGGGRGGGVTVGQIVIQESSTPEATALAVRRELLRIGYRNGSVGLA